MKDYTAQNKAAWEFNAYDFWVEHSGTPEERAAKDLQNPLGMLKKYAAYFDSYEGLRVANICGSCGEMAHARFYPEEIRKQFPLCQYRKYTLSEIINAVIGSGFVLKRFDEFPAWTDQRYPGEFTIIAVREEIGSSADQTAETR